MGLNTTESVRVPAPPAGVFPFVSELDRYPAWLGLVHAASRLDDGDDAWTVELRARVGPFSRSKQLRMIRTTNVPGRRIEFEREERDGRLHARWALLVELEATDGGDATIVTMHLSYDGALWTGGLLERILDEEIRRGRAGLVRLVSGEPTR